MSKKKYRAEANCLNCGSIVERKYCQECGQENIEIHENFLHIAGHFIADYLHYDSKFLQSLKILIIQPGYLTGKYLEGKRVSYINPLRLFFFTTIIMVLLGNTYYKKYQREIKSQSMVSSNEELKKTRFENNASKEAEIVKKIGYGFDNISYYLKYISFLLLPVYALAFQLLYLRQKKYYVDHLVYMLHFQSFVYLALSVVLLIPLYVSPSARDWVGGVLIVVSFVYMVVSLRFLYVQSWIKTIAKAVIATSFMIIITTLVVAGFIFVSFFN